ncbi:hypothetical protein NDU88_006831 [Pleurodeles waltl]|uniref:Uncharacterized protein n=1 Tax=Pleurodeles waltl TaxID=8319 RepID=A0AAV7UMS4_PLEWA|nr:hypothetical protein NDU88_006831 [Pleurodeles waltl]
MHAAARALTAWPDSTLGLRPERGGPPGWRISTYRHHPSPQSLLTSWGAHVRYTSSIIPAGARAGPPARGVSPSDDGGPHDLPGWVPYGLTLLRSTPELLVGLCPEGRGFLRRVSGGFETQVTAGLPRRSAPIRQPILAFTSVPCLGSLHIVPIAHVPRTPGGSSSACTPGEVTAKRNSFTKVKQRLRELNYKYALLFPAKLWVIDGEATRLFQSPEDVWTWLHAKGLVHSASDTLDDTTWLTPHSKRRKEKSSKAGPFRTQAVTEQEKATQETAHFSHNSLALSNKFQFPSDSDTGATSPSKASGDERAPLMTPRLADDL